jgi:hypothetical protein
MTTELKTINLVAPKVLEAYGADGKRLNFNDVYDRPHVNVEVPHYVGMLNGHTVRVRWTNGRYEYNTETLTIDTPAPLNFKIPRLEVIDSIGALVTVNYSVRLTPGAPLIISKSLSLNVDKQDFDLSEPRLSDDRKKVTVKFLNMTLGYTVRVRWHGVVVRDTESQPIQNSSSMTFDIPANWITENTGKSVLINYSVHRSESNDNLMFSRLLRITF